MGVPEDNILLATIAANEFEFPSLGLSGVSPALVSMYCISVGCDPDGALDVFDADLPEGEQVIEGECVKCGQWRGILPDEVFETQVVITLKPRDSRLGGGFTDPGEELLVSFNVSL